jgi:hypothetical protein
VLGQGAAGRRWKRRPRVEALSAPNQAVLSTAASLRDPDPLHRVLPAPLAFRLPSRGPDFGLWNLRAGS